MQPPSNSPPDASSGPFSVTLALFVVIQRSPPPPWSPLATDSVASIVTSPFATTLRIPPSPSLLSARALSTLVPAPPSSAIGPPAVRSISLAPASCASTLIVAPASSRMAPVTVMAKYPPSSGAWALGAPCIVAFAFIVRLAASMVTPAPAPLVSATVAPPSRISAQVPKSRSEPGLTR